MPDVKGSLANVNSIIEEFTKTVPLLGLAYKLIWAIWKRDKPEMTFAQFNARLATESINLQVVGEADLISMGYTKVNGEWVKSGAVPQVDPQG